MSENRTIAAGLDINNLPNWAFWQNFYETPQIEVFLATWDLIHQGLNLEEKVDGNTQLFLACRDGYNEVVNLLLNNGANIEAINDVGMTPIFYCGTELDTPDTLQLMIDRGANINHHDNYGDNLLHQLVSMGSPNCIELLLNIDNCPDPYELNNDNNSAYNNAILNPELARVFTKWERDRLLKGRGGLPSGGRRAGTGL